MTKSKLEWKSAGILMAMAISLLTAGWWLGGRGERDAAVALADASALVTGERPLTPDEPATTRQPSSISSAADLKAAAPQPLPDLSIPFAEVIDDLKARADRGDAKAACRLATEAVYCREEVSPGQIQTDEQIAERVSRQPNGAMSDKTRVYAALRVRDQLASKMSHCAGVDRAIALRAPFYQLQAANAGHVRSMVEIAFPSNQSLAQDLIADPSLAHLYQQNMAPMLLRALRSGDPMALIRLHVVTSLGAPSALRSRLPDNLRNATVTGLLYERVIGELMESASESAPDTGIQNATANEIAQANDLYDRYFRDSPRLRAQKARALRQQSLGPPPMPNGRLACDEGWEEDDDFRLPL